MPRACTLRTGVGDWVFVCFRRLSNYANYKPVLTDSCAGLWTVGRDASIAGVRVHDVVHVHVYLGLYCTCAWKLG